MLKKKSTAARHSRLTTAVLTTLLLSNASNVLAQESAPTSTNNKATDLEKVTVTGSLIPQTTIETSIPVTIITAQDIQARGFNSIAEVLQQSSFASGAVQGAQANGSFTQGAEAVSMFGLKPGYTKYLIDGRPMVDFPALYSGSDMFNSISGLPIDLVDRVEILPGGASSLYGSDALGGVINIILKKDVTGTHLSFRGGTFTEGGGSSSRIGFAKGIHSADERFNLVVGAQYETSNPIWGYDRSLTDSVNQHGYTAPAASPNAVVIRPNGTYYFPAGADNCRNRTGLFNGTEGLQTRTPYGSYCGSMYSPGTSTIRNSKDSGQLYGHATFDFNENAQLYADALYSAESAKYSNGNDFTWWATDLTYGYIYDQSSKQLVNLQYAFAPEEIGASGYRGIMDTERTNSYQIAIGLRGTFGASTWEYDASFMRNEMRLTTRSLVRYKNAIDSFFENRVLGPRLGITAQDYGIYNPDYAAFFTPITPQDFESFTGFVKTKSKTWDDLGRFQLTNSSLFSLPGGAAGFAAAAELGNEGWSYQPDNILIADPKTLDSGVWGQSAVTGAGHRTRYAAMTELRLPVAKWLTTSLSGRYDSFNAYGKKVSKPTWSAGLEFRPIETLLIRGKYGTAFKAPTLSDTYQGFSGYYTETTDYYRCGQKGYKPADTEGCDYVDSRYFGTQQGNTDLKPITAKTWNAGVVWAPIPNLSLTADFYSWRIQNEVDQLSGDQVALQEYYCRNGLSGYNVTSCNNALSWLKRGALGNLESIYTPKVNIGKQTLQVIALSGKYKLDLGNAGTLNLSANYTQTRKHELQTQPGNPYYDLINDPSANWGYSAGPRYKADASISWNIGKWTTTTYANQIGPSWNYIAFASGDKDYVTKSGAKAGKWNQYTTYNLGVDYTALDNLTLTLQFNNVLNNQPNYMAHSYGGSNPRPYNGKLYNPYGRAIYAKIRYDFGIK